MREGRRKERSLKELINPRDVYKPPEPYSQGVRLGNLLFIAGQVALGPNLEILGQGDARAQARVAWTNIKKVVEEAGGTLSNVGRIAVYLARIEDAPLEQEVRREFFPDGDYPTCTVVQIAELGLPGLLMEIEATAVLDS
jgi:2-iminobutanoate/2-iminopropanoate deaminase